VRPALAVVVCSAALLAGCGDATPKVGSAAYLSQCRSQLAKLDELDVRFTLTARQVADVCACIQREVVRRGLGDKQTDDRALAGAGRPLARFCEAKVLARRR